MGSESQLPSRQDPEQAKRLIGLGEKTLFALIKHFTGLGAASDISKALFEFFWDKWERRKKERLQEFGRRIVKAEDRVRPSLESKEAAEPLEDVFVSVMDALFRDDEDEKVSFYAAFMIGYCEVWKGIPSAKRFVLLQAVKALRSHDLRLLGWICVAPKATHRMLAEDDEGLKERQLFSELIPSSLGALINFGLISEELAAEDSEIQDELLPPGREDRSYEATDLGQLLWSMIERNL